MSYYKGLDVSQPLKDRALDEFIAIITEAEELAEGDDVAVSLGELRARLISERSTNLQLISSKLDEIVAGCIEDKAVAQRIHKTYDELLAAQTGQQKLIWEAILSPTHGLTERLREQNADRRLGKKAAAKAGFRTHEFAKDDTERTELRDPAKEYIRKSYAAMLEDRTRTPDKRSLRNYVVRAEAEAARRTFIAVVRSMHAPETTAEYIQWFAEITLTSCATELSTPRPAGFTINVPSVDNSRPTLVTQQEKRTAGLREEFAALQEQLLASRPEDVGASMQAIERMAAIGRVVPDIGEAMRRLSIDLLEGEFGGLRSVQTNSAESTDRTI